MIIVAHWRAQSFKFEQFTDLWDFCDQLQKTAHEGAGDDTGEGMQLRGHRKRM